MGADAGEISLQIRVATESKGDGNVMVSLPKATQDRVIGSKIEDWSFGATDASTAQGLDLNGSGSIMMYENGRMVKSASRTLGSSTYSFNEYGKAFPAADSLQAGN